MSPASYQTAPPRRSMLPAASRCGQRATRYPDGVGVERCVDRGAPTVNDDDPLELRDRAGARCLDEDRLDVEEGILDRHDDEIPERDVGSLLTEQRDLR